MKRKEKAEADQLGGSKKNLAEAHDERWPPGMGHPTLIGWYDNCRFMKGLKIMYCTSNSQAFEIPSSGQSLKPGWGQSDHYAPLKRETFQQTVNRLSSKEVMRPSVHIFVVYLNSVFLEGSSINGRVNSAVNDRRHCNIDDIILSGGTEKKRGWFRERDGERGSDGKRGGFRACSTVYSCGAN